ncbi:DUF4837 family protein [Rhodohalobacter mucosus]|uniref:DUF4837 domain-containing protein n=1 Tax=Rhodohalobacter mucosus TaxID=2079485 RepID=A0A316TUW2_9BACT|nr:DUF4837 family protein [Rhodohalobacter mucosus]PWN07511.1 DUF4837 domain-containing protein [Rhodohalobacter mucosus]
MKKALFLIPVLGAFILASCESDYRPASIGSMDEIIVVMDSTSWDSETALAIEETFGAPIRTIPYPIEPKYKLTYRDFRTNDQLDRIQEFKNIIFAAPIDSENNIASFIRAILSDDVENRVRSGDSFAFPLEDQWMRDQWTLILSSTSDQELAEKIRNADQSLVGHLESRSIDRRTAEVYRRGEQTDLNEMLWDNYGWQVRMQHDYIPVIDTTDAVVFARYLPDNNRRMWAWWADEISDFSVVDQEWINTKRDSLMQIYMQGERDSSYVTTDYRRPIEMTAVERDDRIVGYETMGMWQMVGNFMGGPFVNFTYFDPETERLFMVEYWQFAPGVNKRRFIRQFQAMGRTFEADSTWNTNQQDEQPVANAISVRD